MIICIILLISIELLNLILYFSLFIIFLRPTINKSNYIVIPSAIYHECI